VIDPQLFGHPDFDGLTDENLYSLPENGLARDIAQFNLVIAWSQVEFLELLDRANVAAVYVYERIFQMRVDLNFAGRGLPRRIVPARSPVVAVPTGSISIIEVWIWPHDVRPDDHRSVWPDVWSHKSWLCSDDRPAGRCEAMGSHSWNRHQQHGYYRYNSCYS